MITKGVGFLPLLRAACRCACWPRAAGRRGAARRRALVRGSGRSCSPRSALWFVPMMLATAAGGELLAYRNEILFHQTVTRYAEAWHHHAPVLVLLRQGHPALVAAAHRARAVALAALARGVARHVTRWSHVLLAWVLIVRAVLQREFRQARRLRPAGGAGAGDGGGAVAARNCCARAGRAASHSRSRAPWPRCAALAARVLRRSARADARHVRRATYWHPAMLPLAVARGVRGGRARRVPACGTAGSPTRATLGVVLCWSPGSSSTRGSTPCAPDAHSWRASSRRRAGIGELALVGAKEQYLLQLRRPSVNFGHARWREKARARPTTRRHGSRRGPGGRCWSIDKTLRDCASRMRGRATGQGQRSSSWFLVTGVAGCGVRGAREPRASSILRSAKWVNKYSGLA